MASDASAAGTHRPVGPIEPHLLLSGAMLAGIVLVRDCRPRTACQRHLAIAAADLGGELRRADLPGAVAALCCVRYQAAVRHLSIRGIDDWQTAALLVACGDMEDDPSFAAEVDERFVATCGQPGVFERAMAVVLS